MVWCWWIKECRTLDTKSGHKLRVDFWLWGGSAPLTPELTKGLLYTQRERCLSRNWFTGFLMLFSPSVLSDSATPWVAACPGFCVLHYLLEFVQTHVHRVNDAIQPSHCLLSASSPALNHSQHWSLLQGVGSSHQVAKVLELQLQHQPFQWIFRTDFL